MRSSEGVKQAKLSTSKAAADVAPAGIDSTAISLNPPGRRRNTASQPRVIQVCCDGKNIGDEGMNKAFSKADSGEIPRSLKR